MISFSINGQSYAYPTTLGDILLDKWIAWTEFAKRFYPEQKKEGNENLDEEKETEESESDKIMKALEITVNKLSFFSGADVEILKKTDISEILALFESCESAINEEADNISLIPEYIFNGESWEIASSFDIENPEKDRITFNEYIHAKEIIRLYSEFGEKNDYAALKELCLIFFRKKGEAFSEKFMEKESERRKEQEGITMDIALAVNFFFQHSIALCNDTSLYSKKEELEVKA